VINFSVETAYEGTVRAVWATYEKYTLSFGIFAWPWVPRFYYYRTLAAQIIDLTGPLSWLIHFRYRQRDGYSFVHFRVMCVGVGFKWEVTA
jgi:hypothetical protein